MDCEPANTHISEHALKMSNSGPGDYILSERSIDGYIEILEENNLPVTLFIHPEIAKEHKKLLINYDSEKVCFGMHIHPYKLTNSNYKFDLGAYSYEDQYNIIKNAGEKWRESMGYNPLFFRAGYFSANDNTYAVLDNLGYIGGSVSIPGRILPSHYSIWAGTEPFPHRANLYFRQSVGKSNFIEIPVSVDFKNKVKNGDAGEKGYEWLYITSRNYDHSRIVKNILKSYTEENRNIYSTLVIDTHNDVDYSNKKTDSSNKLQEIIDNIESNCKTFNFNPFGVTIENLCKIIKENQFL
jgi:hypothetical protein